MCISCAQKKAARGAAYVACHVLAVWGQTEFVAGPNDPLLGIINWTCRLKAPRPLLPLHARSRERCKGGVGKRHGPA